MESDVVLAVNFANSLVAFFELIFVEFILFRCVVALAKCANVLLELNVDDIFLSDHRCQDK